MTPSDVVVLGTGGNCVDICDAIEEINRGLSEPRYRILGFLDDAAAAGTPVAGYSVLGPLSDAPRFGQARFVNGIGSPTSFPSKPAVIARTGMPAERFETIVHPTASISPRATVGRGVVILQNAVVASGAVIGDHVIVLPTSVISHDDVIGDYTCLAGGVVVSGNVTVGSTCYLGANSSIIGRIRLGELVLVGTGSVVLRDVPANSVVVGNPARFLRHTVEIGKDTGTPA